MTDLHDPLVLFRSALAAINAEDWTGAAALVDPVSLRAFHHQLLEQFVPVHPHSQVTVDDYLRSSPDTPRAVAEHWVSEARRNADPTLRLARELPRVTSIEMLRTIEPAEAFARWLDGKSYRRQFERLVAEGRVSPRAAELRRHASFAGYGYVALGVVADGDRVAHVLYRLEIDAEAAWTGDAAQWLAARPIDEQALARELCGRSHPSIATCRRQDDGSWRLIVEGDFLGMGATHLYDVSVPDEPDGVAPSAPE